MALNSYFMLPDQGMKEYEILSRSSLFLVRASKKYPKKFHIVSTAHVTHPFLFPNLYPAEYRWLKFVTENDTINKLQIRQEDTGQILEEFMLERELFRQEGKDLVILHLEDEEYFERRLERRWNIELSPLELVADSSNEKKSVWIVGHDFTVNQMTKEEVLVPAALRGEVNLRTRSKLFVKSEVLSVMGMCGAPVLVSDGEICTNKCIGMVEALVHPIKSEVLSQHNEQIKNTLKRIEQNSVVLPAHEILQFISHIEEAPHLFFHHQPKLISSFSDNDIFNDKTKE